MSDFPSDIFPVEIVLNIFKYFDTKTLSSCMLVNKKWRQFAEQTIEDLNLWDLMVKNEMVNNGTTFVNKCTIDNRNIFKNFVLYNYIGMAIIKRMNVYKVPKVEKIIVCKDNLILVNDLRISYYDIKTFKKTRIIKRTCIDFDENPTMLVQLVEERDYTKTLYLLKKSDSERDINKLSKAFVSRVKKFRLENEGCYVFTIDTLCRLTYTGEWEEEELCSYRGGTPAAIHIHNDTVYTVDRHGYVHYLDTESMDIRTAECLRFPWNTKNINAMVVFDKFSAAIPVHTTQKRLNIVRNRLETSMVLEYLDLSCGVQHGDVLILGFSDGGVEILTPKNMSGEYSKLYFNIRDYLEAEEDHEILTLNVWETINSHILLIGTCACVYQFQLSYPEILF